MKRRRSWQRGMRGQTLGSEDRMIALFEGFAADFQSLSTQSFKNGQCQQPFPAFFKSADSCLVLKVFFICSEDILHDISVAPVFASDMMMSRFSV